MNVWEQVRHYISTLDWTYIMTFIILAYGVNSCKVAGKINRLFGRDIKTRYKVAFFGVLYGVLLYFLRDYQRQDIERLLQSFVFALVFHKLIIDALIRRIAKQFRPEEKICDE